jgi:hypothetical protein
MQKTEGAICAYAALNEPAPTEPSLSTTGTPRKPAKYGHAREVPARKRKATSGLIQGPARAPPEPLKPALIQATAAPTPQDYYLPETVAKIFDVSERTLKRWRLEGRGPAYVRVTRKRIIYAKSAVDDFCATRTFAHRADELARGLKVARA